MLENWVRSAENIVTLKNYKNTSLCIIAYHTSKDTLKSALPSESSPIDSWRRRGLTCWLSFVASLRNRSSVFSSHNDRWWSVKTGSLRPKMLKYANCRALVFSSDFVVLYSFARLNTRSSGSYEVTNVIYVLLCISISEAIHKSHL